MLNAGRGRRNSGGPCDFDTSTFIYLGMLEYFARLFTYDEWANGEVLAKLSANGGQSPRSLKLFGHILAAQRLWLERLQQRPQTLPVWPDLTVQQCEAQAEELP